MEKKILFLKARTGQDDPSPPMAFSFLGGIAKKKGWKVLVENLNAQYNNKTNQDIANLIKKEKPAIVGVHIFTNCARDSYNLIKEIMSFCKIIVAGGPHPTACPGEVIEKGADIVVIGEAEISFPELLDAISSGRNLKEVRGIAYKENGKVKKTEPAEIIMDLNNISMLDRSVHRLSDYVRTKDEINNLGQILSTRGCPGRCAYCYSVFGKCYRFMSAEKVFEEISYLNKKYGITVINFIDDAFTINKARLNELCDLIIKSKLQIEWTCSTRIDFLDENMINKMKKANCTMITLGVESCLPQTLLKMKKTGNPEWYVSHTDDVLKWCKKAGIRVGVNMLAGFPWESAEDMRITQKYIGRIKKYVTNGFYGGILQPQPGTEMYEKYAKEYGFEQWWIKKKPLFKDNYRPFFMTYYHQYWDHLNNNFFKFSEEYFREIDKLYRMMGVWYIYVISRRRFKNELAVYSVYLGVLALSIISYGLFKISRKLERSIMERVKKFSYRFKFRKGAENYDL